MSYEKKILQMKKLLGKKKEETEEKPKFQKPVAPSYLKEWEKAGLLPVENEYGVLFKRQVHYSLDYKHGQYELKSFYEAMDMWESSGIEHPFCLKPNEKIVFFDTETTGLKGVGTYIFLLGLLEIVDSQFILTQYVLADPANEAAFLFESKFWQNSSAIITYNGKSFDWPQIETRWTMNQQVLPKLCNMRQIDLLHSTKRLWKNNLERMKLTTIEEEKLGFTRKGDIPGFLAPIIYLDAVKSGNAESLIKVLFHNEWDLLSLVTLYVHSTHLLLEEEFKENAVTHTNIGKWFNDLKQREISEHILLNVTNEFNENEAGLAYFYLAFQQKRNKQFKEAVFSFEKSLITINFRQKIKVYEQLAMIHEHQLKNYEKALIFTEKGLEAVKEITEIKEERKAKYIENWIKRYNRIEKKINNQ